MKKTTLLIILIVASLFTNAQIAKTNRTASNTDKDSLATKSNEKVTTEEKAEIKKMVRWENNMLIAQPGYRFTRVNENTAGITSSNRTVEFTIKCACTAGTAGCKLWISLESAISCTSVNGCVCLLIVNFNKRSVLLRDVF